MNDFADLTKNTGFSYRFIGFYTVFFFGSTQKNCFLFLETTLFRDLFWMALRMVHFSFEPRQATTWANKPVYSSLLFRDFFFRYII